jgi:large subunit ribosomal protein L22
VAKVVRSAAANAENNFSLERDRLQLLRIEVDGGPTIKRFRPRARGASFSIFKRTCHLKAVVEDGLERPSRTRSRVRPTQANTQPPAAEEEEE